MGLKKVIKKKLHKGGNAVSVAIEEQASMDLMYFHLLPSEIILVIFSFLDVKTLGRVGRVCHMFHEIADFPVLWKALLENKHGRVGVVALSKPNSEKERRKSITKKIGSFFVDKHDNPVVTPRDTTNPNIPPSPRINGEEVHDTLLGFCMSMNIAEEDEMDIAPYTSYLRNTIKRVAEYENWNFKDVCRCCVDYPSISEALRHLPSDCKSRVLVRPGTYRENIKIDTPIEIIGIGDVSKIIIENDKPQNVVVIDTKDSKYPIPTIFIDDFDNVDNRDRQLLSRTLRFTSGHPRNTNPTDFGDIFLENNVLISDSCSSICVQHQRGLAVLRGNKITGKSAGISIFKCRPDLTIDSNDIHDTDCSGVEVRPGTNPLIVRNKIHHSKSAGIFVFNNIAAGGIRLQTQGTVVKNQIYENVLSGVDISQGASPVLRHNNISHGKGLGIYIHDGGKGVIEKNEIHHNAKCNIFLHQSGSPTIRKNKIYNSGVGFSGVGEEVQGELINNEIYNHESEGIGVLYKANPIVRHNKIHSNKKAGVVVSHDGRGTFEGNMIYNNAGGGFHIQQRQSPTLKDNVIENNELAEEMQHCIANNECTFSVTGYSFRPQVWYYCDTCAPQKDLGCCESCAKVCHEGHKLSEKRYSLFFCDCAAEWHCKISNGSHRHKNS